MDESKRERPEQEANSLDNVTGEDPAEVGAPTPPVTKPFAFSFDQAFSTFLAAVRKRGHVREQTNFDISDKNALKAQKIDLAWVANARAAYEWKSRTPFAAVLCGLVARASNPAADPMSLQAGSGTHGYSATRLWKDVIRAVGEGKVSLRQLKDQPFNNSPFNGKRRLSTDWENVSGQNKSAIEAAYKMLEQVERMDRDSATSALEAFLIAAPNPPSPKREPAFESELTPDIAAKVTISLVDFADAVVTFIESNSDDGRRAQAFVVACLEVALPGRVMTPASVNDPSVSAPGDVKTYFQGQSKSLGPVYVEVKDRLIRKVDVTQFVQEVARHDDQATACYAALANRESDEARLPQKAQIPSGSALSREFAIPVVVWKTPLDLMVQAIAWAAIPVPLFIWRCAHNYRKWLAHLDTGKANSPAIWSTQLDSWGLVDDSDEAPAVADIGSASALNSGQQLSTDGANTQVRGNG